MKFASTTLKFVDFFPALIAFFEGSPLINAGPSPRKRERDGFLSAGDGERWFVLSNKRLSKIFSLFPAGASGSCDQSLFL